jgi:hypothetical protein
LVREPTAGVNDHDTPVLLLPFTVAENCVDWPRVSQADEGDKEILTGAAAGCNVIDALAVLVESATLVAISVTLA